MKPTGRRFLTRPPALARNRLDCRSTTAKTNPPIGLAIEMSLLKASCNNGILGIQGSCHRYTTVQNLLVKHETRRDPSSSPQYVDVASLLKHADSV